MEVLSIETAEAGAKRLAASKLKDGYELTAIHRYRDKEGKAIYEKIRCDNRITGEKWLRPMWLNETKYEIGEPYFSQGQKPLYNLDKICSTDINTIYVVEGEKVVDELAKLKILATTSGSATSATATDWGCLSGREINIWHDNDEAGLKYAQEVTHILSQLKCKIFWIEIQSLESPEGGDFVDWLAQNPSAKADDIYKLPRIDATNLALAHKFVFRTDVPIGFDQNITSSISTNLLPNELKQFAQELAISIETDESMAVIVELAVISSIISRKYVVSPKPDWIQSTNLYFMILLPPGNNKTQILNACTEPLELIENEKAKDLLPLIKRQKSKRSSQEARISRMRHFLAREDDDQKRDSLQEEIDNLEATITEIQNLPKYYVNDTTPESLIKILYEQKNHIAIISDEAGILETLSGLYTNGKNPNIDILLKGIDGGRIRKTRVGSETEITINPYLTILLVVQPIIIERISKKPAFQDNGFLERFIYVLPKSTQGSRLHNTPSISHETREQYHSLIRKLVKLSETSSKEKLTLDPKAYIEWYEFIISIEFEISKGKLSTFPGWGSKLKGFVLAIAACLHISECLGTTLLISQSTMKRAIHLAWILVEHSRAVTSQIALSQEQRDALTCWEYISSCSNSIFKMADLTSGMRNKRITRQRKLHALEVLKDMGLVSEGIQIQGTKTVLFQLRKTNAR